MQVKFGATTHRYMAERLRKYAKSDSIAAVVRDQGVYPKKHVNDNQYMLKVTLKGEELSDDEILQFFHNKLSAQKMLKERTKQWSDPALKSWRNEVTVSLKQRPTEDESSQWQDMGKSSFMMRDAIGRRRPIKALRKLLKAAIGEVKAATKPKKA